MTEGEPIADTKSARQLRQCSDLNDRSGARDVRPKYFGVFKKLANFALQISRPGAEYAASRIARASCDVCS
jgi:hypothetical protein